jgi:hypothetical protein
MDDEEGEEDFGNKKNVKNEKRNVILIYATHIVSMTT